MTSERRTNGRCRASRASRTKCKHCATKRLGTERFKRAPACVDVVDNHGGECFAYSSLESRFPTRINLDEIKNRAKNAVDSGKALGTCT